MCRGFTWDYFSEFIRWLTHHTFPSVSRWVTSIRVRGEVARSLSAYVLTSGQPGGQTISVTSLVLSVLTHMAEDTSNQKTTQNPQNNQNPRRDSHRYHGPRRYHNSQEQVPWPTGKPEEKMQVPKDLDLDDEETEQDRSAAHSRQSRGGSRGKQPKRVIEEWANDIYCEWCICAGIISFNLRTLVNTYHHSGPAMSPDSVKRRSNRAPICKVFNKSLFWQTDDYLDPQEGGKKWDPSLDHTSRG